MKITDAQFAKLFPTLSAGRRVNYRPFLMAAMQEHAIDTRKRAVAFLTQLGHESLDLAHLKEIWGPTSAQKRYDIRTDLGNTLQRDGDGEFYKGRGGIGRTGKKQYRRFQVATCVPVLTHPELLELPQYAFQSDALYWTDNSLNRLADRLTLKGDAKDLAKFDKLTEKINGGFNGRIDRQRRYLVAIDILSAADFEVPAGPFPGDELVAPPSALDTLSTHLGKTPAPAAEPSANEIDGTLSKLSANVTAKNAAKKIGFRLARLIALLYAALEAGNLYAWIGFLILILGGAYLVYKERRMLAAAGRWTWSKVRSRI